MPTLPTSNPNPTSMDHGLHIENLDVLIPWMVPLDEIEHYGQPKIVIQSDQRTDALWHDVNILGGLTLDLIAVFRQTPFGRNAFDNAHAYLDKATFDQCKPHLDHFFHQEAKAKNVNEVEYYYRWTMKKCIITLGQGDRFGTYYYLNIKKRRG